MALAKLAVVIGAGVIGSVFTKDGTLSDVAGMLSGALRVVTKHIQQDKGSSRPRSDHTASLLDQVNHLREELQALTSSRSVIVISGSRSGLGHYGVIAIVVLGASGYVYIRLKGLKIADMMFATRRSLHDASIAVGKQLESVHTSISDFKRYFSSRLDRAYASLEESKGLSLETMEEVSKINQDLTVLHTEVSKAHHTVKELETKFANIKYGQDFASEGVIHLLKVTESLQLDREEKCLQASSSSSRAIELPERAPTVTSTFSSPPLALEALPSTSSPSPVESPRVLLPQVTVSLSGLKEISGVVTTPILRARTMAPVTSEGLNGASFSNQTRSNGSNPTRSSWMSGLNSILKRNRSTAS